MFRLAWCRPIRKAVWRRGLPRRRKRQLVTPWSPTSRRHCLGTKVRRATDRLSLSPSRWPPSIGSGGTGGVAELLTSSETRVGVMNASVHFSWTQLVEYPSTHISWADQKLGRKDVLLLRVHLADADMSSDCRFLDLGSSFPRLSNPPQPNPLPHKLVASRVEPGA